MNEAPSSHSRPDLHIKELSDSLPKGVSMHRESGKIVIVIGHQIQRTARETYVAVMEVITNFRAQSNAKMPIAIQQQNPIHKY